MVKKMEASLSGLLRMSPSTQAQMSTAMLEKCICYSIIICDYPLEYVLKSQAQNQKPKISIMISTYNIQVFQMALMGGKIMYFQRLREDDEGEGVIMGGWFIIQLSMGNQLQKEFNIKEKPLKLPGSYQFLKFIHHPSEQLSLIIVKYPHRATPISSTLILPIKEIKKYSQSNDSVAICQKCLPLALFQPQSQTQMKILMHKILKSSAQIGRCFFYMGRIMLWCEEKRGISSSSPEELEYGKFHEKSKVFASGIALINFLYCVYENDQLSKKQSSKTLLKESKSTTLSTKQKIKEKLKDKTATNQTLPQQIKLFFQPKDKKDYYQSFYNMENKLNQSIFWKNISQGLRELLLNMINEDPEKRIHLDVILNIPYFMESNQLRLYSTLTDELETMVTKEAKLFMTSLQLIIKEGLTIEKSLMEDFFRPVLCSMITYNTNQGKPNDNVAALVLSILIQLQKPPVEASPKNNSIVRLALAKRSQLLHILSADYFDSIMSRSIFSSFESQPLTQYAILSIPFAMKNIKQPNYKKQIEFLLINKVLLYPPDQLKESLLLDGLKCMIFLVRQNLISGYNKFDSMIYNPMKLSIQLNFHVLYLYGLMIQSYLPAELLQKMMPKLTLYLNETEIFDQIFVVAKRCVDRILQRLYEQRKINPQQMAALQKQEDYFDMREDNLTKYNVEDTRIQIKKEIEKHEIEKLKWTLALL